MSTLATVLEAPEPAASPAVNFTRVGRIAGAATIVLGAACQLIAFLTIPTYDDTVDRLQWVADNPTRAVFRSSST